MLTTVFGESPSTDDVVAVFRLFDLDQNNMLNESEFCALISSLLHIRDGEQASQDKMPDIITAYQHHMTISINSEGVPLSEFVHNAIHGDIGKLISEAHRVSGDVVGFLRSLKRYKVTKLNTSAPTTLFDVKAPLKVNKECKDMLVNELQEKGYLEDDEDDFAFTDVEDAEDVYSEVDDNTKSMTTKHPHDTCKEIINHRLQMEVDGCCGN